jgi:hypothetical protein
LSPLTGGNGAVRIQLPGQTARSAFTDYAAALEYRVDCTGSGGKVTKNGGAGSVITIGLEAGEWEITLTALHHGTPVGSSASHPVNIISGETTSINLSVAVDFTEVTLQSVTANGTAGAATTDLLSLQFDKDIGGLSAADIAITGGDVTKGVLSGVPNAAGRYTLAVTVTRQGTISVTVTKPGYYVSPSAPSANQATVYYWNPEPDPGPRPDPEPNTGVWPPDSEWTSYGLPGLQQPAGTGVLLSGIVDGTFMVQLEGADQTAYNNLYSQIQSITGETGIPTSYPGIVDVEMGEFEYSGFTLTVMWTADSQEIILTVDNGGGGVEWPSDTAWAEYGLSGLQQPAGTTLSSSGTMAPMLFVTLNSVDDSIYSDLLDQIKLKWGTTAYTIQSENDADRRSDVIMYGTSMASLEWIKADDELTLAVSK